MALVCMYSRFGYWLLPLVSRDTPQDVSKIFSTVRLESWGEIKKAGQVIARVLAVENEHLGHVADYVLEREGLHRIVWWYPGTTYIRVGDVFMSRDVLVTLVGTTSEAQSGQYCLQRFPLHIM